MKKELKKSLNAALALAACNESVSTAPGASATPNGYTLVVRADSGVETYVVQAPDGRVFRAVDGGEGTRRSGLENRADVREQSFLQRDDHHQRPAGQPCRWLKLPLP